MGAFFLFLDVVVADDGDEGDDAAIGGAELLGDHFEEGLPSVDGGVFSGEEFGSAFGVGDVSSDDDEVGVKGGDGVVHLFEEVGFLVGVAADDDADVAGELFGEGAKGVGLCGVIECEVVGGVGGEVEEFDGVDKEAVSRDFFAHAACGEACLVGFVGEGGGGLFIGMPLNGDGGGGIAEVGEVKCGRFFGAEGGYEEKEEKGEFAHDLFVLSF